MLAHSVAVPALHLVRWTGPRRPAATDAHLVPV